MNRAATMREWRGRLDDALVSDRSGSAHAPVLHRVALHHVAARCPAGALDRDPARFDAFDRFVEATFTATREVALTALRSASPGRRVTEIVDATLGAPELLRPGVAEWIRRADRAALSVLRAESVSWAVDARAVAARQGEPEWQSAASLTHRPTTKGVALTATVDALRRTASGAHLLVVRARPGAKDRDVAGQVVLLWALLRGEIANSVVLGMRDSLQRIRFEVDEQLLEESILRAVDLIRWAQQPSLAPLEPGPQCRYCRLLDECPDGTEHVGATRRYPMPPESVDCRDPSALPEPTT